MSLNFLIQAQAAARIWAELGLDRLPDPLVIVVPAEKTPTTGGIEK